MATKHRVVTTMAEIETALTRSRAAKLVRAEAVYYNESSDSLNIVSSGRRHLIACEEIEGVAEATKKRKANVELISEGTAIEWTDLDIQMSVKGLLDGVLGTKIWMRQMGAIGGAVKSKKKAQAARENGKKGGRPARTASIHY